MRKALVGLILAATVMTPVAAQAQEGEPGARAAEVRERYQRIQQRNQERFEQRQQVRQQRQEARQERQEARQERQQVRREMRQVPVQTVQDHRNDRGDRNWRDDRRDRGQRDGGLVGGWRGSDDPRMREHQERYDRRARENAIRYGNPEQRREAIREQRQAERRDWREDRRDWRDRRAWNRDWRRDHRYDWQRWRYSNRNLYRMGRYYAPYYGHNYSRFSIGVTLGSPFYHRRYWIDDPWQYRLPYAPAGYRWVRYYDDVLLVDTWNGRVVDVIYDFFW